MEVIWITFVYGETVLLGSVALINPAGCARLQVPDCYTIFLVLFLKVEKWDYGSALPWTENKHVYWLAGKTMDSPNSALFSCDANLLLMQHPCGFIMLPCGNWGKKSLCKHTDTYIPFCAVSNKDHCLWPRNLMSSASTHQIVTANFIKVKEESEKVDLRLNIQKLRSWHPVPSLHGR